MPDSTFKKQEEVRDPYELPVIHAQHYVEKEYNMLDLRQAVKETEPAVAKTVALASGVSVGEDPGRRDDNAAALAEYDSTSVAASKGGNHVKPAANAVIEAIKAARSGARWAGVRTWHTPAAVAPAGAAAGAGAAAVAAVAGGTVQAAALQAAPAADEEDAPWHTAAASLAEDRKAQADLAKHEALLKELEEQQKQRQKQRQQQQEQQQASQQQAWQALGVKQGGSSAAAVVQAGTAGGAAAAAARVPAAAASRGSGSVVGGTAVKPHPVAFMTMYEKMLLVNPNKAALADYASTTALAGPITRN